MFFRKIPIVVYYGMVTQKADGVYLFQKPLFNSIQFSQSNLTI